MSGSAADCDCGISITLLLISLIFGTVRCRLLSGRRGFNRFYEILSIGLASVVDRRRNSSRIKQDSTYLLNTLIV